MRSFGDNGSTRKRGSGVITSLGKLSVSESYLPIVLLVFCLTACGRPAAQPVRQGPITASGNCAVEVGSSIAHHVDDEAYGYDAPPDPHPLRFDLVVEDGKLMSVTQSGERAMAPDLQSDIHPGGFDPCAAAHCPPERTGSPPPPPPPRRQIDGLDLPLMAGSWQPLPRAVTSELPLRRYRIEASLIELEMEWGGSPVGDCVWTPN